MNKRILIAAYAILSMVFTAGCEQHLSTEAKQMQQVQQQQSQYNIAQPVPTFNWSMERHLLIQLYKLRNQKVATHTVWRSDYGMIEGDCPSMGYGLPYDTSLTNPYMATNETPVGWKSASLTSIGQAEPNGIFASTNTSATWVMCTGPAGSLEPIYVESKVTTYPYPVKVDYKNNRVIKAGEASVSITSGK